MTNDPKIQADLLPEDLLWADGGHASDVVLTAMADGQNAIVPTAVRAHVETCRACSRHLGNAALLLLHAERELAVLAKHGDAAERAPLPRLAIALGLAVAALGLVPSLMDPSGIRSAEMFATHDLPMLANGFGTLLRRLFAPESTTALVLTYGASAILVFTAIAIVRFLPKKETSR